MCDMDAAILSTLGELARRAKKGYCYPSQRTILDLVERFYGVSKSRRTLNRRLSFLECSGYFVRIRRIRRGSTGCLVMRSTLYKLTGKFYRYMGLVYRRAVSFFQVFRVPFMAHNQSSTDRHLSFDARLSVDNPVDSGQRGGAPRILKGIWGF